MVSSAKSLGVAVIGLGVGRAHVSSFRDSPGVEVRVICDIDRERSRAAHSLVRDATISESWYDAVMAPSVDVVVVATPDYLHAEIIECALAAGKHVYF
jgi:predicted dehydrogenase